MMKYLTEAGIREAALDYLKRQLANGNTLAKLLLEAIDFQAGELTILSPVSLNSTQLREFDWGHAPQKPEDARQIAILGQSFIAYPKVGVEEELAQVIQDSLTGPEYICLLENELAQPGDPWLKRAKSCVVSHGTEIYHVLTQECETTAVMVEAIRESQSLPVFIGAIGPQPASRICLGATDNTVSTEQLRRFTEKVNCLFGQAYDGEGYVLWRSGAREHC